MGCVEFLFWAGWKISCQRFRSNSAVGTLPAVDPGQSPYRPQPSERRNQYWACQLSTIPEPKAGLPVRARIARPKF